MKDQYIRRGKVLRVLDGDTLEVELDLGYRVYSRQHIRLRDVNAPELRVGNPWGDKVREAIIDVIASWKGKVEVRSFKDDRSFERWLGDVYSPDGRSDLANHVRFYTELYKPEPNDDHNS